MTPGWAEALARLAAREAAARAGGGEDRLEAQRRAGKLTARERLDALLDRGSFVETNMLAEHQCRDFGMDAKRFPGDGVVTGHGRIDGRPVCAYAEDVTVLGGSNGRVHGTKIHTLLRAAREARVPVVGLHDSGGARIQEGMDNVYGMTGMLAEYAHNSGVVPQIVGVMGTCAGGAAYSAALADFVVQVEGTAQLFVTGPALADDVLGETVTAEMLGGCDLHARESGVTHLVARDDRDAVALIRRLLAYLPQSNRERPAASATADPPGRVVNEFYDIVPIAPEATYDMHDVVRVLVDGGEFLEIQPLFAPNIVIGFGRVEGRTVGVIANQPQSMAGTLNIDAGEKAARFLRFCDAFSIPILTLVDVPGYLPGTDQEWTGVIRRGAKLLYAYAEATVPLVTVITRKAYGGAYIVMGSKQMGADLNYAWPTAEIAVMGGQGAVNILYRGEIKAAEEAGEDVAAVRTRLANEYTYNVASPFLAAERGELDGVIEPAATRVAVVKALRALRTKRAAVPPKKHGNIPL